MEAFLIFLTVFITLISSICTALLVPFRQRKLLATNSIPMLVLNVIGYALTVVICAIVPTLYYRAGIDTDVLFVVPLAIAAAYVIAVVVTEFVCGFIGRKEQADEQPVEEPNADVEQEMVEEQVVEEQVTDEQVDEQPVEEVQEETVEEPQVEQEPSEEVAVEEPVVEEQVDTAQPVEEQVDETQQEPVDDNPDKE